jgi:flagellin
MSLFRIHANTPALTALNSVYGSSNKIAVHQARLASGKRINTAKDDSAGYAIARSLQQRSQGLRAALSNVRNAKSILTIAEGGYQAQMDVLLTIKGKTVQAADSSLSTEQRTAVRNQVKELLAEVDDIQNQAKWNGNNIFGSTFSFHVGADKDDKLAVTMNTSTSAQVGGDTSANLSSMGETGGEFSIEDETKSALAIGAVDTAIQSLATVIQGIGDTIIRLGLKSDALSITAANTEATRSMYEDADMAQEQIEFLKHQIVQQTGISALSQANTAPQIVLSLFR